MNQISPVTRSKAEARQSYNRMSGWYDLFSGSEKKFSQAGLRLLDVRAGERVLEIGAGTGHALAEMARRGARLTALDIAEGMLHAARKRRQAAGVEGAAVDFVQGDALRLPYPSENFEAVFISFTLELFDTPEIPLVLAECRRVLCVSGRVGVVALVKEERTSVRIYEWFHTRLPALVDCRPIFARQAVQAAGFEIAACEVKSMWRLPVEILIGRKA
jgi:demethylmenaquinone methyltransferase/2-methoxy-6-polyprenyl-1,4-benzoquinol methylase